MRLPIEDIEKDRETKTKPLECSKRKKEKKKVSKDRTFKGKKTKAINGIGEKLEEYSIREAKCILGMRERLMMC